MAIIPQPDLFSWDQVDASSEMDRLRWVLDAMPDEPLMCALEADRECLKYRCPAAARGIACTQRDLCKGGCHTEHGRIVRVPLATDRRIFTPQARDSITWDRQYKHRSAVERVNSRIDLSFGFEHHFIRGMKKMRLRLGLALVVMLAMAVGRIRAGQSEHLRSLVKPAA